MNNWRILLTRNVCENAVIARVLQEAQIYSYSLPLLTIIPLTENPNIHLTIKNLHQYQAIIVVSKPAANLLLDLLAKSWDKLPLSPSWFSVGEGTGKILHNYGLQVTWPKLGIDSEALLQLPSLRKFMHMQGNFLLIGGVGGREFLTKTLVAHNCNCHKLELYQRVNKNYADGQVEQIITFEQLNAVFITSLQALDNFTLLTNKRVLDIVLFVPSIRLVNMAHSYGFKYAYNCDGLNGEALITTCKKLSYPLKFDKIF